ncbi:MAG: c-di-GMP phosphodiesterase [Campylobacterota bacterium]|nr:c-di-GMP phosphodiesterase [Campylobacterota bacterium]
MKTLNYNYQNENGLSEFVNKNELFGCKNTLVQIFSSINDSVVLRTIAAKIKELLPSASILGVTTAGEIVDAKMQEGGIVISFSLFEKTLIKSKLYENCGEKECAKKIVDELVFHNTKALIVFSDGLISNGEELIKEIARLKPELIVAGGRAGDDFRFLKTFVFDESTAFENGFAAASLSGDELIVNNSYLLNWLTIGEEMTITKAKKNRVFTVDNMPIIELYKKYLGADVADSLPVSGMEFPLILRKGDEFVARAPIAKKEDGSLVFAGNLNEGEKVKFGFANIDFIKAKSFDSYENFKDTPIESMFIYSCVARKSFLEEDLEYELSVLNSIAPTVGFFTYGEFFHSFRTSELLNTTTTVLTLSESKNINPIKNKIIKNSSKTKSLKALSNLASVTIEELEIYKKTLEERVQEEIWKRKEQEAILIHQSRLASLGEMMGNIAHQWRQPLNALSLVCGNLQEAILEKRADEAYLKRSFEKTNRLIQKMSATIDDFRDFFKPDKERKTFNLKDAADEPLNVLDGIFKHMNIRVIKNIESEILIESFYNEFTQALLNILNNAKDAILENKIENPIIKIDGFEKDGFAYLLIEDNAGGVEDAVVSRIFEPYFTTKHQTNGAGIGLYITKVMIVDHIKGSLRAYNQKDSSGKNIGAVFEIKIPSQIA